MSLTKKINLRPEEEIILVVKRYILTYLGLYLFGFLLLGVASFLMFYLFTYGYWGYIVYTLIMVFGLYVLLRTWFFNNKNFLLITSQRVIDVNRVGWFDEYIYAIIFQDIKDIYIRKQGILANIFNYGSLAIESRNNQTVLEIDKVHAPQDVLDLLLESKESFVNNRRLVDNKSVYRKFIQMIDELSEAEVCELKDLLEKRLEILDSEMMEEVEQEEVE